MRTDSGNGLISCDTKKLLVVDDDTTVRRSMVCILSHHFPSYNIDEAQDGAVALEMFKKQHHMVILSDLCMPIMNGVETFENISSFCLDNRWQMPRFIFVSGYDAGLCTSNILRADDSHCFLHKPVSSRILVNAVAERL